MKSLFLPFLLLLSLLAPEAAAQTDSLRNRHEVGADFLPLLRQDFRGGSLLYRRHKGSSALRVRFSGNYSQHLEARGDEGDPFFRRGTGVLRVGKEWGVSSGKMRFYYGLDGMATFGYSYNSVQQPEWHERLVHTIGLGIMPLVGFKYNFNQHFAISAETNSNLMVSRDWVAVSGFMAAGQSSRNDSIGFNIFSDFALFLSYRF